MNAPTPTQQDKEFAAGVIRELADVLDQGGGMDDVLAHASRSADDTATEEAFMLVATNVARVLNTPNNDVVAALKEMANLVERGEMVW